MKPIPRQSPNYSSRGGYDVAGTVIHYTGDGPGWDPISWLRDPRAKASAHYVIERSGVVSRLVKLTDKAWHAGISEMPYHGVITKDASRFTIGVEIQNAGQLVKQDGSFYWEAGRNLRLWDGVDPVRASLTYDNGREIVGWWEPYNAAQIEALQRLLEHLSKIGYEDAASNLVGHEEIALPFSERKKDPGPLFPWDLFPRQIDQRTRGHRLAA